MKDNFLAKNTPYFIDLTIITVWGIMTIYIVAKFLNIIKSEAIVDFSGILGVYAGVTGLATQVLSFYRGSSKSSEDKTKIISGMSNTPNLPNIPNIPNLPNTPNLPNLPNEQA